MNKQNIIKRVLAVSLGVVLGLGVFLRIPVTDVNAVSHVLEFPMGGMSGGSSFGSYSAETGDIITARLKNISNSETATFVNNTYSCTGAVTLIDVMPTTIAPNTTVDVKFQATSTGPFSITFQYTLGSTPITSSVNGTVTAAQSTGTGTTPGTTTQTAQTPTATVSQNHYHEYIWVTTKAATATTDGEMAYVCKGCGATPYKLPISGYGIFQKESVEKIRSAAAGATVEIETNRWISFHKVVLDTLAQRPDVTVRVSFLEEEYKGNRRSFTIPAGTDALSLLDENGYAGFRYLGGLFGLQ